MKSNEINDPTMCNRYPNNEIEHIFCFKGRPFGCLSSPHLPTPTATLVDYNLVKDLGMKMYDLQYQKFSFCGNKLRILGRVSISVQTIHNGFASGSFHIKANVILDLHKSVDCESVAGLKLKSKLENISPESDLSSSSSGCSSPPSSSSRDSSPSPSSHGRTPPQSPKVSSMATTSAKASSMATTSANPPPMATPSARARPSATPSSPPGFPPQPHYRYPGIFKPKPPDIKVSLTTVPDPNPTILTANIYALSTAFNNADLYPTTNQELHALVELDPDGRVVPGDNATTYRTSQGLVYEFGHGRNRCVPDKCMLRTQEMMPHNCGFHRQFYRPYDFQICGSSCSGSLCNCLNYY